MIAILAKIQLSNLLWKLTVKTLHPLPGGLNTDGIGFPFCGRNNQYTGNMINNKSIRNPKTENIVCIFLLFLNIYFLQVSHKNQFAFQEMINFFVNYNKIQLHTITKKCFFTL